MFLSDASLKRPIAVTVGLVALAIFGVIAYRGIGVDLVPQVDVPYVSVTVVYPGRAPTRSKAPWRRWTGSST